MRISSLVWALAFGALVSSAAFALDAAPTSSATPAMDAAARAAKSAECDQKAAAKDLHFRDRRKFHSECMRAP